MQKRYAVVTITVTLSEDCFKKPQDFATQFNIPVEQLLRVSFEEFASRLLEDFPKTLECVFETYKELYKRPAQNSTSHHRRTSRNTSKENSIEKMKITKRQIDMMMFTCGADV